MYIYIFCEKELVFFPVMRIAQVSVLRVYVGKINTTKRMRKKKVMIYALILSLNCNGFELYVDFIYRKEQNVNAFDENV